MDVQIKIVEVHPEQFGMDVNFSTAAWPEGRTIFVIFPVDANGAALQGDALMDYLADIAPAGELEQREALSLLLSPPSFDSLVGVAVTRSIMTTNERKVAAILAAANAPASNPNIADLVVITP